MPIPKPQRFEAWSLSRLNDWEECALKAKLKHLDKLREPEGPALSNGRYVHLVAQGHSTDDYPDLPGDLSSFKAEYTAAQEATANGDTPEPLARYQPEFDGLRAVKRTLHVEQDMALTKSWQPTGWFDKDAWLRIKMDLYLDVVKKAYRLIVDFKTGKVRKEKNRDQLELYSVGGLAYTPPSIKRFETELWYLDHGETVREEFTRDEAEALKPAWERRVAPMLLDTRFEPTPGDHCRFCFFGQSQKKDPKDPKNPRKQGPGICQF